MTETRLGLLRHGQTDWNVDFRLQGVTDIPLNATGVEQANRAAEAIVASDWDLLLSSPLSRALDTAKIISQRTGLRAPETEELLLERAFGEAEGLTHQQWKERYANLKVLPGGESLDELEIRVKLLLAAMAARYEGKRVLAVSHGALIRKIIRVVSNRQLPLEGDRFANASLSTIVFDGQIWRIENFNPHALGAELH